MKRIVTISVILFIIKILSGLSDPDFVFRSSFQRTIINLENDSIPELYHTSAKENTSESNVVILTSTISQNASIELL
jgi:hypothetical protein